MKKLLLVLCILAHGVMTVAQLDTTVFVIHDTDMLRDYQNDSLFYRISSSTGAPVLARIDSTDALRNLGLQWSCVYRFSGNIANTVTMTYTKVVDSMYTKYYAFPPEFVQKKRSRIHGDFVQYDIDHIRGKGLYEMYYTRPISRMTIYTSSGKKVCSYAAESDHLLFPRKRSVQRKLIRKLHQLDSSKQYSLVVRDKNHTIRTVYKNVSFKIP